MALSLSHVLGRRTLAIVSVGAATALTSWFIYLRNRYLKQITQGKESGGQSGRSSSARRGECNDSSDNAGGGTRAQQTSDGPTPSSSNSSSACEKSSAAASAEAADLQMESLSPGISVKPPAPPDSGGDGAAGKRPPRHNNRGPAPPIAEEDDSAATEAQSQQQQQLSGEFIANRLAAMSKSDCANVHLVDGDSAVLARCLRASCDGSGGAQDGGSGGADTSRALQLIGRLAQFQHHLDRLSRGGELVEAVCDAFKRSIGDSGLEVRLQCLLNLVNLSGVPSNQQAILTIVPDLVDAIPVPRLSQYALQLLANLALYDQCRPQLTRHVPAFLEELRRQMPDDQQQQRSADQRRLKQCLTLLSNLTSDPAARRQALLGPGHVPAPAGAQQLLDSEPGVRLVWVCCLANLTCEPECLAAPEPGTLAAAFMSSLPALSKVAQKLRDKLRSAEKSTEYGQKVTSLSKELKSLLRQAKVKSR